MKLSKEQIDKFKSLHRNGELDGLTEGQISEIAGGVGRLFLALYKINNRQQKENEHQNQNTRNRNQDKD